MKKFVLAVSALFMGIVPFCFADVTLESGETLTLSVSGVSAENVSGSVITAKAGSTIKLLPPEGDAGEPGFCRYENPVYPAWPGVGGRISAIAVSNYLGVATDIWPANERVSTNRIVCVFSATWAIPSDAVYSFYEDIDDAALIAIDGKIILSNTASGTATCVRDIALTAGDHVLMIALANGGSGSNPFGANQIAYAPALCYSATNAAITREDKGDAQPFTDPGDGSIFRSALFNPLEFRLNANLLLDGGEVTLDCTALNGTIIPHLYGGLLAQNGGSLTVAGSDRLDFGGTAVSVHFPIFDAPVRFAESGTLHFNGFATLPTSPAIPYVIEPDSDLALWGTDTLGSGDITLATHDLTLLNGTAVNPDATITIANGRKLTVKFCSRSTNLWNTWSGMNGVLDNNIVLDGENALLHIKANKAIELTGAITGTGNVRVTDQGSANFPCVFSGTLDYAGSLTITDSAFVRINAEQLPNPVTLEGSANISFTPAAVTIDQVTGRSTDTRLRVAADQTLSVGTLSGAIGTVGTDDETSKLVVDTVSDNASILIYQHSDLAIDTLGTNVAIHCSSTAGADVSFDISLAHPECPAARLTVDKGLTANFKGDALTITGEGTTRIVGTTHLYTITPTSDVIVAPGGRLEFGNKAILETALGELPALWLDPSEAGTLQQYNYNDYYATSTNGIMVRRWNDCRPGHTGLYALQPRGEGYLRVYPYSITNALNGRTVISFGKQGGSIPASDGHVSGTGVPDSGANQTESRRIIFNKPITAETAVMVFGSQFGGGYSVLGGYTISNEGKDVRGDEAPWANGTTRGVLKRANGNVNDPSTPILGTARPVWLDGQSVNPTATGFSGDYQVLSLDAGKTDVRSLGWFDAVGNSGGQIYGEVLIYTNTLTHVQRSAVEAYLAVKWAIPGYPATPHSLQVEEGGTVVYAGGDVAASGKGTVEVSDQSRIGSGIFTGTVALQEGSRLDLSALPLIPTEEVVKEDSRIGWFDPDCEEDITFGDDPASDCIWGLFDHGKKEIADSLYLHGTFTTGATGDRRPHRIPAAHGNGPVRGWLDYSESTQNGGNTLRFKTDHSLLTQANFTHVQKQVKTGFVVLDTVRGGGVPVIDTVSGTVIKTRQGTNVNAPIWPSGTTASLTNGNTYLDGVKVNGRVSGYSGRPEVLSFTTDGTDVPIAYLGYYQSAGSEKSCEFIGESLFYGTVLDDAARADIEAYLMGKWLGVCRAGYTDFRQATVTGSGTLAAKDLATLPSFDADFSGTLELSTDQLAFHIDATPAVTDTLTLPASATLMIPESGTLNVTFAAKPAPGTYPLIVGGNLTDETLRGWTLTVISAEQNAGKCVLERTARGLNLNVIPSGTLLILK